jgi:NAD(P)-dependent dehydrogenase (short-subunit alcohol dehydrogenase family)
MNSLEQKDKGKVAIVTGASSGIGKATANVLVKAGYRVHVVARRLEAMRDLERVGATLHSLDLTHPEGVSQFVQDVIAREGRIDLLVNNAGYGSYGAVEDVPMAEARHQIDVNLFAPAQLIQEILPTMRAQRSGKIINVTSIGGKLWSPMGAWYHASKFALEGLSDCLRNEVRPFGIDVVLVEPGGVKTEWGGIAAENAMKTSGEGPYGLIARAFYKASTGTQVEKISANPEEIADLIGRIAATHKPRARYVAPLSGRIMLFVQWLVSDSMFDWLMARATGLPKRL